MKQYDVREYVDPEGNKPFQDWLLALKDSAGQAKLVARVDRASYGNFGDWKPITNAKGLFEMREHYGPGYRIYYSIIDNEIVLLLIGSLKKDQNKGITTAKKYLEDYLERNKKDGQKSPAKKEPKEKRKKKRK